MRSRNRGSRASKRSSRNHWLPPTSLLPTGKKEASLTACTNHSTWKNSSTGTQKCQSSCQRKPTIHSTSQDLVSTSMIFTRVRVSPSSKWLSTLTFVLHLHHRDKWMSLFSILQYLARVYSDIISKSRIGCSVSIDCRSLRSKSER